jgi:putative acetyltransferase
VAEAGGQVVGSVGLVPSTGADAAELRMLYVRAAARRSGLGGRLLAVAEDEARRSGARRIQPWRDTRFTTAHRFYERRGYRRGPATRELHDLSASVEYFFSTDLQERQANRESASPARPSTSPP